MAKNAKDTAGKGKDVTPRGEETKQNANTERAGKPVRQVLRKLMKFKGAN